MTKSKRAAKKTGKTMEAKQESSLESLDQKEQSPKQTLKPNIYLQYAGNEYSEEAIIEQIRKTWLDEANESKEDSNITSMEVYLKPEEACVYYVINGSHQGKLPL